MATAGHIAEAKTARGRAAKKLHHIEVHPAKNGGHTVQHHYHSDGMAYHEPDIFAFGEGPETISHLMDHLGVKENAMLAHLKGGNEEEAGGESEQDKGRRTPAEKGHAHSEAEEKGED